jgi:hypothetical protein
LQKAAKKAANLLRQLLAALYQSIKTGGFLSQAWNAG